MNRNIFEDLFVLEMTNNHLGSLERGLEIVKQFSRIARFNNVRAAIKLQFRDVKSFVHKDYYDNEDIRYIKRTMETELSWDDYAILVKAIVEGGCIPMATPFDEYSVDMCCKFNMPIIKVASADSNDWILLEKIAKTKKPVIISLAGTSIKDTDDVVTFFENRNIPLALNHCIATYPSEDGELELNQIDYLKNRYPNHTIGLSTHESNKSLNLDHSLIISYAKGARMFEKHIDIDSDGQEMSLYSCSPHQLDSWFKAFKKAHEMCGTPGTDRKLPLKKESEFLDKYTRGVYAKRDLPVGYQLHNDSYENDIYLSIPILKGQISCRELMNGETILRAIKKDEKISIDDIDSPYATDEDLKKFIYKRGF